MDIEQEVNVADGNAVRVITKQGTFYAYELGLKDIAELVKRIKAIMPKVTEIWGKVDTKDDKKTGSLFLEVLPDLIIDYLPEVQFLLVKITRTSPQKVEELGIADTIKIIEAGIQANDVEYIMATLKKVMPRSSKPAAQEAPEQPTVN